MQKIGASEMKQLQRAPRLIAYVQRYDTSRRRVEVEVEVETGLEVDVFEKGAFWFSHSLTSKMDPQKSHLR